MMEESDYLEKRVNVNKTTHHNYPQDAKFQCLEQLRNTNQHSKSLYKILSFIMKAA